LQVDATGFSSIDWRKALTEQTTGENRRTVVADSFEDEDYGETGLLDGIRFLYSHRLGLAVRFLVFFGLGIVAILLYRFSAPIVVQGTLSLTFRGMERFEYPSGKKFSVEDFRSPDLLSKALVDAGVPQEKGDLKKLAAQTLITPVIPADIQSRWKKADKDGTKKEEYYPNEFDVGFQIEGLTNGQLIRLFDALTENYRRQVKYEQEAALKFISDTDFSYDKIASSYDFWDIPELFQHTYRLLDNQLSTLITESLEYADAKYQFAFRKISNDLHTWQITRLQPLEALTYEGHLVKNRDFMLQRILYRAGDLDIQIKQKTQEASEAERLLGIISKPNALLAGQLNNKDGMPVIDASALDKLIKSDYVGPVVSRISKLQAETQALEAERARLQKQLAVLPKASNVTLQQLPPGYRELIDTLSSELKAIARSYNSLLDEYLTATIASLVTIRQSPVVTRGGYSLVMLLIAVVVLSFFLAISLMGIEHLHHKLRSMAAGAGHHGANS
jgi:hypothetical protein